MREAFYEIRQITDLRDMIDQSAKLFGEKPAFKLRNKDGVYFDIPYSKFRNDIYGIATELLSRGVTNEKIAVMGANRYEWCCAYLGIISSGNVAVPIDKELPVDDIKNILKVSGVKAIFLDKHFGAKLMEEKSALKCVTVVCFDAEEDENGVLSYEKFRKDGKSKHRNGDNSVEKTIMNPDSLASLLFTSGTTGMSKGVCLSQGNIASDLMSLSGCVKIYPQDRLLSILPLHHTYECSLGFMMSMYSGACVSFCRGLRHILQDMQEVRPTVFVTVPLMIEKMHAKIMKKSEEKKGGKLLLGVGKIASKAGDALGVNFKDKLFAEIVNAFGGSLRLLITGAAPLDPRVAEDFITFGINIYLGYGLTECSPLVIGNNDRLMLPDSVGVPLPGVEAKVANPDGLGIGEICVKGPMVMHGYYNDEAATSAVIDEDGFFHTGDLGTVDENGYFRITGRCKNVIVTKNGKNIYPEEVEHYLNNNPFIEECMVFGSDEENEDTMVAAKIFPNLEEIRKKLKQGELTQDDIKNAINDAIRDVNKKLPKYKKIMKYDIRENEFIKTTTQKIKRYANMVEENKNNKEAEQTANASEEK